MLIKITLNIFLHAISNSCINGVTVCVRACIYTLGVQRVKRVITWWNMSVCVPESQFSDKVCDVTVSDIISKGVMWYVTKSFREDVYLFIRELVEQ